MIRSLSRLVSLPGAFVALAAFVSHGHAQRPAGTVDSAGVHIVTSDPRDSDTYCALSDEPTLRLGVIRIPEPWFVEAHAADGTLAEELVRLDAEREGTWEGAGVRLSVLFDPQPSVHARGTTVAIATAKDPEVRLLDERLRLRRIVRWEDADRKVTRAHVEGYRDEIIERRGGRDSEEWHPVDDARISDRRPAADVFPPSNPFRSAVTAACGFSHIAGPEQAGSGGSSQPAGTSSAAWTGRRE